MIFEPDIRETDDGASCRPPFSSGYYWQVRRRGFMPELEAAFNASESRAIIDRQTLLEFSWHRGPVTVLGVQLDGKTLQSFVEHLEGDELDVRRMDRTEELDAMLIVRQGQGLGGISAVTFRAGNPEDTFTLKYEERIDYNVTKEQIAEASNRSDFAAWTDAIASGNGKVPRSREFEGRSQLAPIFGAPTPTLWFDDQGNGPNLVELMVDGFDFVPKDEGREISGRVGISFPGTALKGGGSFNVKTLTDFIGTLTKARTWLIERLIVPGCECGICSPHMSRDCWCEPARTAHAALEPHDSASDSEESGVSSRD